MSKIVSAAVIGLAAVTIAACSTSRPSFLTPTPASVSSPILRADLNNDKSVSCEEWQSFLQTAFQQNDTDRDGALSELEYDGLIQTTGLYQNVPLGNIDTDFNRSFSFQELDTFSRRAFSARDRDANCALAGNELKVAKAKPPAFPSTSGGGGGGPVIGGSFTN